MDVQGGDRGSQQGGWSGRLTAWLIPPALVRRVPVRPEAGQGARGDGRADRGRPLRVPTATAVARSVRAVPNGRGDRNDPVDRNGTVRHGAPKDAAPPPGTINDPDRIAHGRRAPGPCPEQGVRPAPVRVSEDRVPAGGPRENRRPGLPSRPGRHRRDVRPPVESTANGPPTAPEGIRPAREGSTIGPGIHVHRSRARGGEVWPVGGPAPFAMVAATMDPMKTPRKVVVAGSAGPMSSCPNVSSGWTPDGSSTVTSRLAAPRRLAGLRRLRPNCQPTLPASWRRRPVRTGTI